MGLGRFEIVMFWSEFICILFYGLFVEFGDGVRPNTSLAKETETAKELSEHYPMYMDIHVMIFVGFGFLMAYLKNSSWTAVGFSYLIACWALQITVLMSGFWRNVCH
jgi:ammonium transporter Rh